ncbi:hypothetical protein, conserved [Leishmania lindenbergi]|uniref:Uncharacterized protein n=1 Tax=Leishmania lindenbergi TaxID=651832 RepID=A0AAW3AP59_9TRYP
MAGTIPVSAPSFVTVTLTPAPGINIGGVSGTPESSSAAVKSKTLRVPVTASTTVRELAKGAVMRYLLSLRRAAKETDGILRHLCRAGIAVTDVYLLLSSDASRTTTLEGEEAGSSDGGGALPVHMVELLYDDCVVQVVQVMKETVHMCFRAANAAAAKKSTTLSEQAVAAAGVQSTDEDRTTTVDALTAARAGKSNSVSIVALPVAVAASGATRDGPDVLNRDGAIKNAVPSACVSDAVSDTAQASSSTPVVVRQRSKKTAHKVDSTEEESRSEEEEGEKEKEEWQNIALSIATLRERESQRIRWGPDAHKHFAANYVSSPEKIMIGRFKCGRRRLPVVQLHPTPNSSSTSSQGSVSDMRSPRSLRDSKNATETCSGSLSPRPVGAQETDTEEDQHWHQRHEHRHSPQHPCKHHRCNGDFSPCNKSSSINPTPEVLISTATTEPQRSQVTATPSALTVKKMYSAAEEATVEGRSLSLNSNRQESLLYSAATPVGTAARTGTSPLLSSTVAKPVVAVVARQLSYEEDGTTALKHCPAVTKHSEATPVCRVQREIQG